MEREKQEANSIYEARVDEIISPQNGKSAVRMAKFLRPCTKNVSQAVAIPHTPLLSEIFSHDLQKWPSEVLFKGWKQPQRKWKEWVDRLAQTYNPIWRQTGIYDAIMSSTYEMRCNHDLLLGLSEFWCSDTNTFVFPWGEATITLEDVMIIGGYPVVGEAVNRRLDGRSVEIVEEMNKNRILLCRSKAKKATDAGWLLKFTEGDTEYEHVAFLSLWLSRYVFPSLPEDSINANVFPIAALLSQGAKIALAPAVLASLYQNLTMLKQKAMVSAESIVVSGPLALLQLWAFERFPLVGPNSPNSLQPNEPRAARWHKLSSKINLPLVRSALRLQENFRWRPYAAKELVLDGSSLDEALESFLRCLQVSELVGIGCKENYRPQRVAMQFGMDQDLPCDTSVSVQVGKMNSSSLFLQSFEPGVSSRYLNWWKDCMCERKDAVRGVIAQEKSIKYKSFSSAQTKTKKKDFGMKYKSFSSAQTKTKTKKKDFGGSVESASLKRSNQAVPKFSEKFCHKGSLKTAPARIATKSKISPSVRAKSCRAAVNDEESRASSTRSSNLYQVSSDEDNIVLADRLARKSSSCKGFSRVVNENCRKRKLTKKEYLQGKANAGSVKVAKKVEKEPIDSTNGAKAVATDVQRKADHSENGSKRVARDVKGVAGEPTNNALEFEVLSKSTGQSNDSTNGAKEVARDMKRKADHSENGSKRVARDVKRVAGEPANNALDFEVLLSKSTGQSNDSTNGAKGVARDVKRKADHSENGSKRVARDVKRAGVDPANDALDFELLSESMGQSNVSRNGTKGVSRDVQRKADHSENGAKGVARDVKRDAGDPSSEALYFEVLSRWMGQSKVCTESVKVENEGGGKNLKRAGESVSNPINVDGHVGTSTSGLDLEGRVKKIEELLGVKRS